MEEKIKLYDMLKVCSEYLTEPENEEKIKAYNDMMAKLVIRDYVPLQQKELLLRKALMDIRMVEDTAYHFTAASEIALVFDILLFYVVNLDVDSVETIYKDYDYLDLLEFAGVCDTIKQYAGKDYDKCVKMFDRTVSYDNVTNLIKEVNSASPEKLDSVTDELKRFRATLTPEMLKTIGDIYAHSDPLINTVKNAVEETAWQAVDNMKNIEK